MNYDNAVLAAEEALAKAKAEKTRFDTQWRNYQEGACFIRKNSTEKKFNAFQIEKVLRVGSIWEEYISFEDKEQECVSTEGSYSDWKYVAVEPEAFLKVGQSYPYPEFYEPITREEYIALREKVIKALGFIKPVAVIP